jgi:hypothetical protein
LIWLGFREPAIVRMTPSNRSTPAFSSHLIKRLLVCRRDAPPALCVTDVRPTPE